MSDLIKTAGEVAQRNWLSALEAIEEGYTAKQRIQAECQQMRLRSWSIEPDLCELFDNFTEVLQAACKEHLKCLGIAIDYDFESFSTWNGVSGRDRYKYRDLDSYQQQIAHARTISLSEMAERLAEYLTPAHAERQAIQQAADKFFQAFQGPRGRAPDTSPITVRGDRRVLVMPIYTDATTGGRQMSAYGSEQLIYVISALSTLVGVTSQPNIVTPVLVQQATDVIRHKVVVSRMKLPLGAAVELVFFNTKIEFVFSADALEAVQFVMAQHRTQTEESA